MRARLRPFFERHPTLTSLLLVAVVVGAAASDVPRLRRARPGLGAARFDVALVIGLAAAALICAATIMALRARKPLLRNTAVAGAGVAWFVTFAWSHPRHFYTGLTSATDVVMAVASDIALLLAVGSVVRRRPARREQRKAPTGVHDGEVWYVVDNKQPPTFEPYYVAHCSCDWVGPARPGVDGADVARRDALAHTPKVSVEVTRPLA